LKTQSKFLINLVTPVPAPPNKPIVPTKPNLSITKPIADDKSVKPSTILPKSSRLAIS
jgi:hypothetical protein